MNYTTFLETLPENIREHIKFDVELKEYTTFKIGGKADLFIELTSIEFLTKIIASCTEKALPYFILGKGSNLLISDEGIEGIVIFLSEQFSETVLLDYESWLREYEQLEHIDTKNQLPHLTEIKRVFSSLPKTPLSTNNDNSVFVLKAEAGASLKNVSHLANKNLLTGLEFACGIPGSIGGALYMNAGAYGNAIEDVVFLTLAMNKYGELRWIFATEHNFSYRKSCFALENLIILQTYFILKKVNDSTLVKNLIEEYTERRTNSQPLEWPSAGSVFKRPEGYFVGKLIQEHNLKGFSVGGASVSTKHAGFIINHDKATSQDVITLIKHIKKCIKDSMNITLETEIRFVGRNNGI